jgi:hypothetical protein
LVTAQLYRHFLFGLPWELVPARIVAMLGLLAESFMGWGLWVGLAGLGRLFRVDRAWAYGSLSTFLLICIYAIGYDTTDSYIYLLPACLIFSVWLGVGLYELVNTVQKFLAQKDPGFLRQKLPRFLGPGLLLLPLLSLSVNFSTADLSRDNEALVYAQQILHSVEPGAVIITDSDPYTFSLWYGRYGLGQRPDIAVINHHLLAYDWYRQTLQHYHAHLLFPDRAGQPLETVPALVEANIGGQPIYLAMLKPVKLNSYQLEMQGPYLQRVVKLPEE